MRKRSAWNAIKNGLRMRCPSCGEGRCFSSYLKVSDQCPNCGEELHHHRADDAPPYIVIAIVGKIVVPLAVALELAVMPPVWLHALLWGSSIIGLSLLLLPPVKGAVVGIQWANRMHGFGGHD